MPLIVCPDCGGNVSSEAPTCPHCGRPVKQVSATAPAVSSARSCPHCGAHAVGKVRGLQGVGEVLLVGLLTLVFFIPGVWE